MDRAEAIAHELAGLGLDEPLIDPHGGNGAAPLPLQPEAVEQAAPQQPQEPSQALPASAPALPPLRTTEAQRAAAEGLAGALRQLRDSFEGVIEAAEVLCCSLTVDAPSTEVEIEDPEPSCDHVVAEVIADEDGAQKDAGAGDVVDTDDEETANDAEVSEAS